MMFFPVIPGALFIMNCIVEVQTLITGSGGLEWQKNSPGKVFFIKPESFLASFIWENYLTQSIYVYNYLMLGTDPIAVGHTMSDSLLTKTFWRKNLEKAGAYVAPELAFWDGPAKTLTIKDKSRKEKAIIKVNDGYLGAGDKILKDFELGTNKDY